MAMVPLEPFIGPVKSNWPYATANNFTKQVLYHKPAAYLRKEAALALQQVHNDLLKMGYDIFIYDAYRPYSVTQKMWEIVPDDRYAANPANGSGHNRGVAVDLTLTDAGSGIPLAMPTGFDNFSDTAHHNFMQLPEQVLRNRALLKTTMEKHGFVALDTEWWHYYLPNPKRYPLLDLNFKQMRQVVR